MDFFASLPAFLTDLELWQYNAIESYGIDVFRLYDSELEILDYDFVYDLDFRNDPEYKTHLVDTSSFVQRGIKTKKSNEYKRRIRVRHVNNATKQSRLIIN